MACAPFVVAEVAVSPTPTTPADGGGVCNDPLDKGCTYNIPNTFIAAGAFVFIMMMAKK
jgi:hypothetical protein